MKRVNPRIISGIYKNKKLHVPESARPYTDRLKRSVFDTIGNLIIDAHVADVFAGSGSVGIEAISRGAKYVTFVETDEDAIITIKQNLKTLAVDKRKNNIYPDNFNSFISFSPNQYDIIFLDPPFIDSKHIDIAGITRIMHSNSIAVLRIDSKYQENYKLSSNLEIISERKFGTSYIFFIKVKSNKIS